MKNYMRALLVPLVALACGPQAPAPASQEPADYPVLQATAESSPTPVPRSQSSGPRYVVGTLDCGNLLKANNAMGRGELRFGEPRGSKMFRAHVDKNAKYIEKQLNAQGYDARLGAVAKDDGKVEYGLGVFGEGDANYLRGEVERDLCGSKSLTGWVDCSDMYSRWPSELRYRRDADFVTWVVGVKRPFLETLVETWHPALKLDVSASNESPVVNYAAWGPIDLTPGDFADIQRRVEDPKEGLCELPPVLR